MSIFDMRQEQPDFYLQHMKDTMDWIERKMREAEEDAAKDPTLRKRGYDVGIYVEGRWLKQLVAENAGMHQLFQQQTQMAHHILQRDQLIPATQFIKDEAGK